MANESLGPILVGGNSVHDINEALRQIVERIDEVAGLRGPSTRATTYTVDNVTTDRAFDANATSTAELADALGTLINDLRTFGVVA